MRVTTTGAPAISASRPEVVLEVQDALAEQLDHEVLGLRALHLHGRDVGFLDRDVDVRVGVLQPAGEQQGVGGGEREPERVLVHPRQHRVVDDAAVAVADQHVLGLTHRALRQIAGREQLGEREAVGPADLQAALHRDVPDRHVVQERLELVLERVETDREVHVVVDGVALAASTSAWPRSRGCDGSALPAVRGSCRRLGHATPPRWWSGCRGVSWKRRLTCATVRVDSAVNASRPWADQASAASGSCTCGGFCAYPSR